MLFTEKDLLNAFKQNVDNKGWIYFVGNPESNAKFLIDWMKANKEEISEEELEDIAIDEGHELSRKYGYDNNLEHENIFIDGVKEGYRKVIKEYGSK